MSAKHIETLQYYKDYAESTAALNESLTREIKDCYTQIDGMRNEIRRIEYESTVKNSSAMLPPDSRRDGQAEVQLHSLSEELHRAKIHIMSVEAQLESQQSTSHSRLRMIQQKEDEVDQLKRTCRELESRIWESEHRSETLTLQLDRQTALSASYQQMLEKRIGQISEMQRQAELQLQGEAASNAQECFTQNEELRSENHQLRMTVEALKQTLERSQRDYDWLKKLMDDRGANEQNLLKQTTSAADERRQLAQQLKRSEDELLQCMRDNDQLRLQLTQFGAQLRQRELRLREESTRCLGLEEELRQAKRARLQLDEELQQLRQGKNNKIEELNSKIEHMNSMLVEERKSYEYRHSLSGGSDQQSNLLSIVSETSFHSQRQADRLRDDNARLTRELQLKNQILKEFEERVDQLTRKLEELSTARLQTVASAELHEQLARTRARLELSNSAVKEANDLRLENSKLQNMVELLRQENSELKKKVALLEAELQTITSPPQSPNGAVGSLSKDLLQLQKEYSETLTENNLLLEENNRLEVKRQELTRDLEDIRLELTHHANAFDQMKDLKNRLRDAYSQMDHLNRLLAERDLENNRRQHIHVRSPQRHPRIAHRANPEHEQPFRSKSPVQRLLSPNERAQELNNSHNGYWIDIQNKIKALKTENEQLRRNLASGPAKK